MTTLDLIGRKFASSDMCLVKMVLLFSRRSLVIIWLLDVYSPRNDPDPEMIPNPEIIPNRPRNDADPEMIPI